MPLGRYVVVEAVEERLSVDLEVTNMVNLILLMYQLGHGIRVVNYLADRCSALLQVEVRRVRSKIHQFGVRPAGG